MSAFHAASLMALMALMALLATRETVFTGQPLSPAPVRLTHDPDGGHAFKQRGCPG
jgi:hypothetical protein